MQLHFKTRIRSGLLALLATVGLFNATPEVKAATITDQSVEWSGVRNPDGSSQVGVTGLLSGFSLFISGQAYLAWTGIGSPGDGNGSTIYSINFGPATNVGGLRLHNANGTQGFVSAGGDTLNAAFANLSLSVATIGNVTVINLSTGNVIGGTEAPEWGPFILASAAGTGAPVVYRDDVNGYDPVTLAFTGIDRNVTGVPEPASIAYMVIGAGLFGLKKRKDGRNFYVAFGRSARHMIVNCLMFLSGTTSKNLARRGVRSDQPRMIAA